MLLYVVFRRLLFPSPSLPLSITQYQLTHQFPHGWPFQLLVLVLLVPLWTGLHTCIPDNVFSCKWAECPGHVPQGGIAGRRLLLSVAVDIVTCSPVVGVQVCTCGPERTRFPLLLTTTLSHQRFKVASSELWDSRSLLLLVFTWLPTILAPFHVFIGHYFVSFLSICLFFSWTTCVHIDHNALSATGLLLVQGWTWTWSVAFFNYTEFPVKFSQIYHSFLVKFCLFPKV